MQEELTLHQVEGEVVEGPSQHRGSDFVREAADDRVLDIIEAALPS